MEQYVDELKTAVGGRVLSDEPSLDHYSKDGSVFKIKPWAVVLPSSKNDVVNLVKWVSRKRREFPADGRFSVTARGKGTDQGGGPINEGIIFRFPGYLDKILEVGPDFIRVEPGVLWKDVLAELEKTGRFVPPYPASKNFATIGGGAANNCSGEKTVKYGSMRDYVLSLKIVLSDGNECEFRTLTAPEVLKKQSQDDLEGEIYRTVYDLLISNHNLIQNSRPKVNKISSGYWLFDLLSDGGLDLTRLVCGDQGTLGIVTEITLKTIPKPPFTGLLAVSFGDLKKAGEAVSKILDFKPSAFELVDKFLLEAVKKRQPETVSAFLGNGAPAIVLLIEFDGGEEEVKHSIGKVKEFFRESAVCREAYGAEQDKLWEIRRQAAVVAEQAEGAGKALPFIEDSTVSPEYLAEYLEKLYEIMGKHRVSFSAWGHAGNGNLHLQPFLDLGKTADREKLFAIADEVYAEVIKLGGALSGEHNDGLIRSLYLEKSFGKPLYEIFRRIKNVFDPYGVFNPRKKIGADLEFVKKHLRDEYLIEISGPKT